MRRDRETETHVNVDLENNRAQSCRTVKYSEEIDELFRDGQLTLRRDAVGWDGYVREDGEYYHVNARHDGEEHRTRVDASDVERAIRRYIEDPEAGGEGRFVRGASP